MTKMLDDPLTYFRQWLPQRTELFHRMEDEARNEGIPIVGPVAGNLLYVLASLRNARNILELGTATGYSTLHLARACRRTGGHIVSLESNEALAQRARRNLTEAGLSDVVDVRCDDAITAIQAMEAGAVDMIFIDIEKKDYAHALPSCARLLPSGGLLIADNTGFKDAHPFNQAVHADDAWEPVNIWCFLPGHSPEHDGLCLALRR